MFSKIKKYVIGFFVLAGGILFAFLSGKSAGRKKELLGGLKDLQNMESLEKDMIQWVTEITEQRKQNPFDKSVANAMANGNVDMTIKKNKS